MPKYFKKLELKLVKGEYQDLVKGQLHFPKQLYKVFKKLKDSPHENLIGIYLNKDLKIRAYDILEIGGSEAVGLSTGELFGRIFITKAKSFILIHNHPKGDPSPSRGDLMTIQGLNEQSKIMDLEFLDFIIIGDKEVNDKKLDYWSLFEEEEGGDYYLGRVW